MLRVIDTIRYEDISLNVPKIAERLRSHPEAAERFGRALLVVLDPEQVASAPVQAGGTVRVHPPDGDSFDLVVSRVDVQLSVVLLFFRDIGQHEVPRLSEIEVLAA
jgi:hypothetical protein